MDVVSHRRALHAIPELDRQLPKTTEYIKEALAGRPCKVFSPIGGCVCAYFDAGKSETAAFRADLDALPVREATGAPYASTHPGAMHACGHDGHAAMVLDLAARLAGAEGLPRNVLLIFQPAEETSGGARDVCRCGVLERYRVRRIFGLHLWPGLPAGSVWSRPGPMMARSSEVTVRVEGRSVHLSRADQGHDALLAAMEYVRRAYDMMDQLPPKDPRVLRFGKMTAGTARNVISGSAVLEGSLRTYRQETFAFCGRQLRDIARAVEAESGCAVSVELSEGNPAVWNHESLYERVCRELGDHAPADLPQPVLAAEDFAFYQQYVPGVFFFLGTGDTPPLHAPDFDFDDGAVLPAGAAFLEQLARLP
ncbi:M20 family metallopeptidase [uncultured Oscillibacter sp.]|uniref:M20 metallopeptidase family protein n=1 Tax=uncultured Oscillibacter sp. TaxID=876091 RepID=UPI0025E43F66|nr:M20 family metallopeptidase [uncultured Oscillibacter sp.]